MEKNERSVHENIDISSIVENKLFLDEALLQKFITTSIQEKKIEDVFQYIFQSNKKEIAEYFIISLLDLGEIRLTKKFFKLFEEELINEKKTGAVVSFSKRLETKIKFIKDPRLKVLTGEEFEISSCSALYLIEHYEYWQQSNEKIKIDVLNKILEKEKIKNNFQRRNVLKCLFDLVCLAPVEGERLYRKYQIKFPKHIPTQENQYYHQPISNNNIVYSNSKQSIETAVDTSELKSSLCFTDYVYELINQGEIQKALSEVQKGDSKLHKYLEIEILYLLNKSSDLKYKTALFLNQFEDDHSLRNRIIKISGIYEN